MQIGPWTVNPDTQTLHRGEETVRLEPKVMALLVRLAEAPGEVCSRETLFSVLWPDVVVGEDTLARLVSKLRRALGDNPKSPQYIQTIPKRGYRLLPEAVGAPPPAAPNRRRLLGVAATALVVIGVAGGLAVGRRALRPPPPEDGRLARADDLYMRFTQADNAAAAALYEQVRVDAPNDAHAHFGLANTLVQRVIRWPGPPLGPNDGATSVTEALAAGLHKTDEAQRLLVRAEHHATVAVQAAPNDDRPLKALGLVRCVRGDFDGAVELYRRAIRIRPQAYAPHVNLGEVLTLQGRVQAGIAEFEIAFEMMVKAYRTEPQRVGRWHADLGAAIGRRYLDADDLVRAQAWFRRVLDLVPRHVEATVGLAETLARSDRRPEARALCADLTNQIGPEPRCESI